MRGVDEPIDNLAPFEALYKREYARVRRYLVGACRGNNSQAEDLTHEVFLEVWQRHSSDIAAMSDEQAQGLLIMTAKNRVKDQWRRNNREVLVEDPGEVEILALGAPSPVLSLSDRMLSDDVLKRFWHVLQKVLTHSEFRVMHMTWVMNMGDTAIAAAIPTTVRTVQQHRCAARKKIQSLVNHDRYEITFSDDQRSQEYDANGGGEETA